jgi:hypothetical protein
MILSIVPAEYGRTEIGWILPKEVYQNLMPNRQKRSSNLNLLKRTMTFLVQIVKVYQKKSLN